MPKKHLSQNFLFDPSILERIADESGVADGETVVEIGPGPGSLTRVLADRVGRDGRLVAIEFDRDLFAQLKIAFHADTQVELVQADVMRYPFESIEMPFRVIANIPYHITTPIIFRLF
jgi:16S rRNA (adenine1518-N6/adenine1519-N6)-dimethyltransferase